MSMTHVLYTGNGTVAVDSGLPHVGRIFAVTPDGNLLWYRYGGHGEANGSGTRDWDTKSGNPIRPGWQDFLHVLGAGDGVVLAIKRNGDLLWYCYGGNGERDPSGTSGWHRNSGNQIGHSWQHFRHVAVVPQEGRVGAITLFAVEASGDLRWYGYSGDGERDPSGGRGWHPSSGNVVGNGWAVFQRVVGTGAGLFAIDPDGAMRWYSYLGSGERDPTGMSGWHRNSGNQIGHSWQHVRHVTGGSIDSGGRGTVLYAVSQNGDLRWYRYDGHGQLDPTGNTGWNRNSGNPIGNGW